MRVRQREIDPSLDLIERIFAARGEDPAHARAQPQLKDLLLPGDMKGMAPAARAVAEFVRAGKRITIAGDYDCDGGGGTAVGVLGLTYLGAKNVRFLVPDRITMGYGLSPQLADMAAELGTDLLITVDNGIAAHAGVARARSHGMAVVVTDHHLAGPDLPAADFIVNPNQPGCGFASKNISGCGVMFYLVAAVRSVLGMGDKPLNWLLDIVALSTVADVVKLDRNNRILVGAGINRIRAGRARPGVAALFRAAGASMDFCTAADFGFKLGPRLNAAGRLDDMTIGINCLIADDPGIAAGHAALLDGWNRERRKVEASMREEAAAQVEVGKINAGIVVASDEWHEGVVGLVAGRLKEAHHRPTIAFTRAHDGSLKGSARSIPGFHIRDALAQIQANAGDLIQKFGGHAMAAGLSVRADGLDDFTQRFIAVCESQLTADQLDQVIETDGELTERELTIENAETLENSGPWGQGFPEPAFEGSFRVSSVRRMGDQQQHVRYAIEAGGKIIDAVHFNGAEDIKSVGANIDLVYRMSVNRWNGNEKLNLMVDQVL